MAVSPVFESAHKKDENSLGIKRIEEIYNKIKGLPIVAIGGINEINAHEIAEAGAVGAAYIGELVRADDRGVLSEKISNLKKPFRQFREGDLKADRR